jgi:hypothetical protein
MKRYFIKWPEASEVVEIANGEYVLYADASARISALEKALRFPP